ncbi:hypothetical protein G9A89_007516 [Geosiphon pyriformis]|nr:hypothetical protein G9A89_007516 [Geosiphon pyriformis]
MESGNNISIITETKLKSGVKPWIMNKFSGVRIFMSGLDTGSSGTGVAVIMNFSVAQHVSKIDEIPGRLISIRLLFKGKLSVTIMGIYTGVFAGVCFGQALVVNSLIASAINSSFFVILDGDFNESDTKKSASLRKCVDLGLVNSFKKHSLDNVSAALSLIISSFLSAKVLGNLDEMWNVLCGIMVRAADAMFSRHWFSEFDCLRNRYSSKFLGLELLVAKIIKSLNTGDKHKCDRLIKRWFLVDYKEAFKFDFLVQNGADSVEVFKHLSQVRKCYKKSKYYESRIVKNTAIWSAINKHMENFSSNKGGIIRSILEWPFCKVVLDHLVIGDELVLDPIEVKSRVDSIMVN